MSGRKPGKGDALAVKDSLTPISASVPTAAKLFSYFLTANLTCAINFFIEIIKV